MAVTSGLNLRISHGATTISTMDEWELDDSVVLAPAVPSQAGAEINTVGAKDFSVRARGFQRVPVVYPGPTTQGAGTATLTGNNGATEWAASAVCKSLALTCDIGASNNLTVEYGFEGMGAITRQASALAADNSEPDVWNAINGLVKWMPIGQVSYATLPDITQWTLTLEVETIPYVSSSSGGLTLRSFGAKRVSGSFTMLQDTFTYLTAAANVLTPGSMGKMQLFLTAGTYLEIWWPVIQASQARASTGANNEIVVPWTWSAYANVSGTQTIGKVLKPKKEAAPDAAWYGSV